MIFAAIWIANINVWTRLLYLAKKTSLLFKFYEYIFHGYRLWCFVTGGLSNPAALIAPIPADFFCFIGKMGLEERLHFWRHSRALWLEADSPNDHAPHTRHAVLSSVRFSCVRHSGEKALFEQGGWYPVCFGMSCFNRPDSSVRVVKIRSKTSSAPYPDEAIA